MCGINGAFVFRGSPFVLEEGWLARMRDVMAHRGPDGDGLWTGRGAGLAHRRLSIVDLDSGESAFLSRESDGWRLSR